MLSKSFKAGKCKTSVKLAVARIKLLRNKRDVQVKHMRRELAQLLESGQEQTARIRVEHVIREEKTMSAYDLIELYCELIAARLPIIESQKTCPIDLKEAIASVIFASPRCADIPELMDIRKHFTAKYGKEFIKLVLEVRPNCGVNRLVVEKLSARAPDVETKIKILTSIAKEHNVKWDSKAFEEQLRKPNDDLLNGPSTFSGASKIPMESSSVGYSSAVNQTKEPSMPRNDGVDKPAVVSTFSYTNNSHTSSTAVPLSSQPELKPSESISGGGVEKSYSREENASWNHPTRKMEFKDATSAAQAAAESADRASVAARAAAEFATRENLSGENSFGSTESPTNRVNNERSFITRGSKLKGDYFEDPLSRHDEMNRSQDMKPEIQNLRSEEVNQGVSRREAGKMKEDFSSAGRAAIHSSSRARQTNISDGLYNVGPHKTNVKDYGHDPKMSSESEAMENNRESVKHENSEYGQAYFVNYTESATSSPDASAVNDESNRHLRFENDVVFDGYGSDADYIGSPSGGNEEHVLDSSKISNSGLHLFSEEYSENMTKVSLPSKSEENVPAMFDDSDGLSDESEDERYNATHYNAMRPSNLVNDQRSAQESFPEESGRCLNNTYLSEKKESFPKELGHGLNNTYLSEKEEVEDITNSSMLSRISDDYKENHERESYTADMFWKRSNSSNSPNNQPSSRDDKSPSNSYDWRRSGDSSSDEDTAVLHSSNVQSVKRSEAKEQLQMPSSPFRVEDSEMPNKFIDESEPGLNYGRLSGGLKNRGFTRPPYVRNSAINDPYSSKQPSGEASSIPKNPSADSEVGKLSTGLDVLDQEFANQDLHPKASMHKSRTSEAPKDSYSKLHHQEPRTKTHKPSSRRPATYSDSDDDELKLDSDFPSENKPIREVKFSRRTRGVPPEGKSNALRFSGRSDASLTSEMEINSSERSSAALQPHNDTVRDSININMKGNSKVLQSNLLAEQPSLAPGNSVHEESPESLRPSSTERFASGGNTVSSNSTSGSASHENSVKSTHTHPKLPDYEDFAAHFRSLRSNRN